MNTTEQIEARAVAQMAQRIRGSAGYWEPQEGDEINIACVVRGPGGDYRVDSISATPEMIARAWRQV